MKFSAVLVFVLTSFISSAQIDTLSLKAGNRLVDAKKYSYTSKILLPAGLILTSIAPALTKKYEYPNSPPRYDRTYTVLAYGVGGTMIITAIVCDFIAWRKIGEAGQLLRFKAKGISAGLQLGGLGFGYTF